LHQSSPYPLETAGELGWRQVLFPTNNKGDAQPGDRRIEYLGSVVEGPLAFDAHLPLAAVFLELLGLKPAVSRRAQAD
jgi:hypothetical protein